MPDPRYCERVTMLAAMENPPKGKGGIVKASSHYKGSSVEIRPPRWGKKIWIGKLETLERAQYVADAVFHYLGMPPFHFEEGVMTLPVITCIGIVNGTPVRLSTREMRGSYVREIAKGEAFQPQRDDFILQVKKVVKSPDFPFLAAPQMNEDDRDREDEIESDEDAAKALHMSLHSGASGVSVAVVQTHVAGPDSVRGCEAVQAYVPSFAFDSNGSENILRSAGQSIDAIDFSIDDCPTSNSKAEKIWIGCIEELDKFTDVGASTPSVASNDGEFCGDGYETSPVLDNPWSTVRPSSQFCESAKRQKIGDLKLTQPQGEIRLGIGGILDFGVGWER